MKAAAAKTIVSYGWVDENAGVAHIPVDRAIDIVLAKGLPSGNNWELRPDEVMVQGVIRKASEVNTPVAPGAVLPAQAPENVPGGMQVGQPNTGAGQPTRVVPSTSNPGTANPTEGTMPMHKGFGGPTEGNKKEPNNQ